MEASPFCSQNILGRSTTIPNTQTFSVFSPSLTNIFSAAKQIVKRRRKRAEQFTYKPRPPDRRVRSFLGQVPEPLRHSALPSALLLSCINTLIFRTRSNPPLSLKQKPICFPGNPSKILSLYSVQTLEFG